MWNGLMVWLPHALFFKTRPYRDVIHVERGHFSCILGKYCWPPLNDIIRGGESVCIAIWLECERLKSIAASFSSSCLFVFAVRLISTYQLMIEVCVHKCTHSQWWKFTKVTLPLCLFWWMTWRVNNHNTVLLRKRKRQRERERLIGNDDVIFK